MTKEQRERLDDQKAARHADNEKALAYARDWRRRMDEAWREAEYPIKRRDAPL